MVKVIPFPSGSQSQPSEREGVAAARTPIQRHLDNYQWHFGRDGYWFFVTEKHRLPNKTEAQGLSALLGHSVKASDGKHYGTRIKLQRKKTLRKSSALQSALHLIDRAAEQLLSIDAQEAELTCKMHLELNKNICEHIANQMGLMLLILEGMTESTKNDTIGSSRRASTIDKGICGAK